MLKLLESLVIIIGLVCLAAAIGLLMAFPVKWCWNYAVVAVWGLPSITWGQAWCLSFLAHIFFKSTWTTSKK